MKNILKKFVVLLSLGFVLVGYSFVFAEDTPPAPPVCTELQVLIEGVCTDLEPEKVSIHLEIISGTNSLYNNDILVTACDSDNNPETPDVITAYCALLQSDLDINWNWDWAPGVFVDSIGEISGYTSQDNEGKNVYHYWSWSLNGSYAEVGLNYYDESNKLKAGDEISLNFVDPIIEPVIAKPTPEVYSNSSSSGSYIVVQKSFSINSAISFLSSQQKDDGSFGDSIYTDWVTIGIAKVGDEANSLRVKILDYLKNEKFKASSITDYERHAMALMSLGINPYTGTNINYIKKITDSFDGTQIGDKNLFNDDIFGLIILQNVGYDESDEIIEKTISYITKSQSSNGSWGSVDMTAAGIMALSDFKDIDGVEDSISKAENYLMESQSDDGGFDNSASTSWAIQALSLNNSYNNKVKDAVDYLVDKQQDDGGLDGADMNNRVWNTSYSIPAILKLSWVDVLESFNKEEFVIKEEVKVAPVIPIKIVKTQKENIVKNEIKTEVLPQEEVNSSILSASVASFEEGNNTSFWEVISSVLNKIKHPFVWLWIHFGF